MNKYNDPYSETHAFYKPFKLNIINLNRIPFNEDDQKKQFQTRPKGLTTRLFFLSLGL